MWSEYKGYVFLTVAIIAEVVATASLKAADGFKKPIPSIIVVVGYGIAFKCLSEVLAAGISVGIAYAIWAGMGIVLVVVAGAVLYGEIPDWQAVVGMALIIAGVVVVNAFSNSVHHAPPPGPEQQTGVTAAKDGDRT